MPTHTPPPDDTATSMAERLPELVALERLIDQGGDWLRADVVARVEAGGHTLPIHCIELGEDDPSLPVVGYFGGVHGAERIGTQVVLAYLHTVVERLRWSDAARRQLRHVRLLFMPLVNPGGMLLGSRANPCGIDLMRNAPIDAMSAVPWLLGGHRLGPWLPWYRGRRGAPMAPEAEALCQVVRQRLQGSPLSIAMDCHSGFGTRDRLWFPYARTHRPFAHLADAWALRQLFNRTYPNHRFYVMEPQSHSYTTHGDLWDYLYDESAPCHGGTFLPFTLEMGSWLWVKKNPRQLLRFPGMFNPVLPHRLERVLRRHLHLFDFLPDVAASPRNWRPHGALRERCQHEALAFWYPETP